MSERELLELAAKAAGIVIDKSPYNGGGFGNTGFDSMGNAVLDWHNGVKWNPLTDDGDALRLAVKMERESKADFWSRVIALRSVLDFMDDPYATTRRAIVRAAAEIGKAMP